jgi:hypothetical protein
MRWEYMVVSTVSKDSAGKAHEPRVYSINLKRINEEEADMILTEFLSVKGSEGWELVAVTEHDAWSKLFFKRSLST